MFDQPLCLFEYACGLFPKDIDQLNEIAWWSRENDVWSADDRSPAEIAGAKI